MANPLEQALEAMRIATDAVQRARNYYDFMQKEATHTTLVSIHERMIEDQQRLRALINE